jgi:LacI family transcriptional regulator
MAIGALDCILDNGLRVPDDISLIGFDDIELGQVVRPRLTTIHQPIKEIGKEAARLIIDIIEKKGKAPTGNEPDVEERGLQTRLILKHSLVERETVRERV